MAIATRTIADADLPSIVDLLCEGFPERSRHYWHSGVARLLAHAAAADRLPPGVPRLGYVMVADGVAVGVILLIHAEGGAGIPARTNISSWYVRPSFRAFGALLVSRAVRSNAVTYVNVSPAPHTLDTIEAQGFVRVQTGCFAGIPTLSRGERGVRVRRIGPDVAVPESVPVEEATMLSDHLRFGCLPFWVETPEGGHPFVFRRRALRLGRAPVAMLIHAPSLDTLERFAGPLGRALTRLGLPVMLAAADRPLRGVAGRHFPAKLAIYAKGRATEGMANLTYTEAAVFGM